MSTGISIAPTPVTIEKEQTPQSKLFVVKRANEWLEEATHLPPPVPLYDELWYQGETAFLFGGTGTGKSLLAVQIAKYIAHSQPVLYFDFELSLVQFAKRYFDDFKGFDPFPENFYRVEFARDISYNQTQLVQEIHQTAQNYQSRVIIIDNLTWVLAGNEKTMDAGNLMKEIAALKRNNSYSILILSHTPKRDETRPISVNDMAGSMVLTNFVDTSFCIAKSFKDQYLRYIKQVKVRSSDLVYGFDSVKILRLQKSFKGFLGFIEEDIGGEMEHLKRPNEDFWEQKKMDCVSMLKANKTYSEIAKTLGISPGVITKWKKNGDLNLQQKNDDKPPF